MKNQEDKSPEFKTFDSGENLGTELEDGTDDFFIGDIVAWEAGNSNNPVSCRGIHYNSYSRGFSKIRMTSFNGKKATLWTIVPTKNLKHRELNDNEPI